MQQTAVRVFWENVLVRRDIEPDFTKGGIYLHEAAKEKINWGTVVDVGEGKFCTDGSILPLPVKVGDKVIFRLHGGHDLTIDDVKHVKLKADELMGVIEED